MRWKKRTLIQIETKFTRDFFCGGRILSRKCSKSSFFVNSISWNCIQYILISRGAAFLLRQGYLKQGSNNILKQFSYFLTKNFCEKVDIQSWDIIIRHFQNGHHETHVRLMLLESCLLLTEIKSYLNIQSDFLSF